MMPTRKWMQAGVVTCMVLIVTGLVLSFIARLRAAHDAERCRKNLWFIGAALGSYHDMTGRFPSGCKPKEGMPPERRLSWLFVIKPYIESRMDESWHHVDWSGCWDAEGNRTMVAERYGIYLCPSNTNEADPNSPGLTHYVGIAGLGEDAPLLPRDDARAGVFGYENNPGQPAGRALGIRKEDIKDGVSTTMGVVETMWCNGPWASGGLATVRGLDPSRLPYLGESGQFSSRHRPEGSLFTSQRVTHVLFADGSVRAVSDSISPHVFKAMSTIAGGEDVGDLGDF